MGTLRFFRWVIVPVARYFWKASASRPITAPHCPWRAAAFSEPRGFVPRGLRLPQVVDGGQESSPKDNNTPWKVVRETDRNLKPDVPFLHCLLFNHLLPSVIKIEKVTMLLRASFFPQARNLGQTFHASIHRPMTSSVTISRERSVCRSARRALRSTGREGSVLENPRHRGSHRRTCRQ